MNIWEIQKELGFKKVDDLSAADGVAYKGVFTTGKFGIGDYNVGLVTVIIRKPLNPSYPVINITTIDDGGWSAYAKDINKVDIELIKKQLEQFGTVLPTENDFNYVLKQFNIWGYYTG